MPERQDIGVHPCRVFAVLLAVFVPLLYSYAQEELGRTPYAPLRDVNAVGIRFERNYTTYLWNLLARYGYRDSLYRIDLGENYSSSLIRGTRPTIRDEQSFSVFVSRTVAAPLSAAADLSSFILSDNQPLGINNAVVHSGMAGISLRPLNGLTITPLGGFRYDRQQDKIDQGPSYKVLLESDTLNYSGYQTLFSGRYLASSLSPRRFDNHYAQLQLRKDFGEGSIDSIRFRWSNNRWDFYLPGDTLIEKQYGVNYNIRSRTEEQAGVSNVLQFDAGQGVLASLTTAIENRMIDNSFTYRSFSDLQKLLFDSRVQELHLNGALDFSYRSDANLAASLGVLVSERDEKHSLKRIDGIDKDFQSEQDSRVRKEKRLDNTARRTQFHGSLSLPFSANDDFGLDGSAGILRYDTPDSLNTDDRDELLLTISVRETHRFSPYLEVDVTAEAILGHTVYLFQERSANNNWNRIIRLSPAVLYTPVHSFRSMNQFEVLANYTVFDFESQIPSVKSYSYRQFAFLDSTSYDMSHRLGFAVALNLRLSERGLLHWKEFSEKPEQYVEEATFSPSIRYKTENGLFLSVGFRSFAQNRYRYSGSRRVYESDFFSYGPTTAISIMFSQSSSLEIHGWRETQQQSGITGRSVTNLSMTVRMLL